MKLVSRTRTHQLTYIAIMSAITIVLSAFTNYFPFSSILLILFLPFIAALVAIICDLKYFPIYLVASILLSIVIDFSNFLNIFFYLIPSMISGLIIGVTYRLKLNGLYILLLVSMFNLLSNYAVIPVLNNLYEINFISYSLSLVGLESHPLGSSFFMLFLYIIALIQAAITYLIVTDEIYVIRGKIVEDYDHNSLYVMLIVMIATAIFTFFHRGIALVGIAILILLSVYQLLRIKNVHPKLFYITLISVILTTMISFILAELHHIQYLPLYLILPVLLVVITSFLWEYILNKRKK